MDLARIGIFGGTFDPIHIGHLFIAEEAASVLNLAKVIFVPASVPPHRSTSPLATPQQRYTMVQLAIADNARFAVSVVELDRPGPSYTVDTLKLLKADFPDAGLFFLIGMDSLPELVHWRDPAEILHLAHIVAVARGGVGAGDFAALEAHLPEARGRVTILDAPGLEISASDIRHRVATGRSIRYFVPGPVADFIAEQGLYGSGSNASE
ncbi:MAG: nicotinate-nucleotide adenylyltransferase [Chloroflexi bacterium]|nr:nicotinate-nucleotide adenylyltransferase [Chloroflexota bacterium]